MSLELTSVCIVDERGTTVRETKVPSEPEDLVRYFAALAHPVTRIALEAGPLSQWLHAGLVAAGFETVPLETLHVKAALSAMTVKTDRHDGTLDRPAAAIWLISTGARQVGERTSISSPLVDRTKATISPGFR